MTFVATASGMSYIKQAEALLDSFARYDWPTLHVVTEYDAPHMDDIWGGRGLKTRFAHLIPDDTQGQVAFIDCDCRAIGPYFAPPALDDNSMISVVRSRRKSPTHGPRFLVQSCLLIFPDLAQARSVCDKWYHQITSYSPDIGSDEPALHRAILGMNVLDIQHNGHPMRNLAHK